MTGTRKMEYKDSSWHETCFICHRCQQPIGTKSFIPKDNQNFCVPCYEKQYAMQCVQCKKVSVMLPRTLRAPFGLPPQPLAGSPPSPDRQTPVRLEWHKSLAKSSRAHVHFTRWTDPRPGPSFKDMSAPVT